MATVFKCDRCGETYKWYDCVSKKDGYGNTIQKAVYRVNGTLCGSYECDEFNICPSCMAKLNKWLKGEQE